jgi:glycosyltransferase involved in cell wall biosynthesis
MKKNDVICFGGEDWWYHNRGHIDFQLMSHFAKKGKVLYINSIVMQKPNLTEGRKFLKRIIRKGKSIFYGLRKVPPGFWVYSPFSLPLHHISWARRLNIILLRFQLRFVIDRLGIREPLVWVACPVACDIAVDMKKRCLVYQRVDRFEDYPNVDATKISEYDRKLKAKSDMTIYVNASLYEEERSQCKEAFFLDHGVDFELFASVDPDHQKPPDIASIPKPIVGYFGALDEHKLDANFIEEVVDLLPDASFVFVGKESSHLSRLRKKKNVWLLGQKTYEQIPHYGKCFDVAIIPWRKSRWTQAANPIKLKEYLALGKPLVSTPAFTELQAYRDFVYEASTPEEFVRCIEKALAEDNSERIIARRKRVENASWSDKARLVQNKLFGQDCQLRDDD